MTFILFLKQNLCDVSCGQMASFFSLKKYLTLRKLLHKRSRIALYSWIEGKIL